MKLAAAVTAFMRWSGGGAENRQLPRRQPSSGSSIAILFVFEPDRLIRSAQAAGLGQGTVWKPTLKGSFIERRHIMNDSFRVGMLGPPKPRPAAWADRTSLSGSKYIGGYV